MVKRLSADALDQELATHNPVSERDLDDAARRPAATALLRHIFERTGGVGHGRDADDAAEPKNKAGDPGTEHNAGAADEAGERVEDPTPSGRLWLRAAPQPSNHNGRGRVHADHVGIHKDAAGGEER